ncbi:Bug family tripartite tricarboxylate transporter substrate binding protein [Falsiroseomonas oryzae]|uniref:Bug family tripartite tricarboxylate transporter substrate binding protein n=1 Tax=Falsiroseomonas oryzae TaxID=2766473 RepID=UPI0022EA9CB1|nr:tripartite tricarboxylate transporter substrate binding protein [Roseomonas sp. MO-31]
MMKPTRRAVLGSALALPFASPALAFPDRPVRLVLGFPAGTGPDVVARILADALREAWPVAGAVVDNRPGAAGHIAAQEVARAAPDGTTLLFGEVGQLAMAPSTYARLSYDPARDFAPVAEVAAIEFAFVVPASVPANDLAGFLDWARAQPQVFMATFGAGTPGHFGASILAAGARINMEAVHFRSTGEAMTAVLNGNVQGMFGSTVLVAQHVANGRVKALATTGATRSPLLPAVPTMAELNLPRLGFEAWFGLVAPAATPEAALAALEAATLRALAVPATQARLRDAGFRATAKGRAAFAAHIRDETARWAAVVRETGFRALE